MFIKLRLNYTVSQKRIPPNHQR